MAALNPKQIFSNFRTYVTRVYPNQHREIQRAIVLTFMGTLAIVFSYVFAGIYASMGLIVPTILCGYAGTSVGVMFWFLFKRRSISRATHYYCFTTFVFFTGCCLFSGAIQSPFVPWLTTAPILAAMLLSARETLQWALVGLGIMAGLLVIEPYAPSSSWFGYPEEETTVRLFAFSSYFFFVFGMILIYDGVRKEMERLVRLTEIERQVQISGLEENLRGRERERQRVAREFHDHLGTVLAVARLRNEAFLEQKGDPEKGQRFLGQLEEIGNLLSEVSQRYSLHLLRDFGIAHALDQLARPFQRKGLPFELITLGLDRREVEKVDQDLYRIAQEITELSRRRPETDFVSIQVLASSKEIRLIGEIRGKGFSQNIASDAVLEQSIAEIRDRSHVIGADFFYEVSPEAGLTLVVELPTL